MAKFISVFIERSHQRLVGFVLWFLSFLFVLALASGFAAHQVSETMTSEARVALEPLVRLRQSVSATFREMTAQLTAEPCSPEFHSQLRAVAFLPDGLNEFLYAPGGVAQCSVSADFPPHAFGTADLTVAGSTSELKLWFDVDLGFMGLVGREGSIALREPFALVIPPQPMTASPGWMTQELVAVSSDGAWWHRGGDGGLFEKLPGGPLANWLPIYNGAFYTQACDGVGVHCVVAEASLAGLLSSGSLVVAAAIVLCALLAVAISGQIHAMLRRYWSFEARFRRNFDDKSIICTYQPILSVGTGMISGCEVLVRWRDVNGATVFPDQFLPIVEKYGLGRQMTKFIVDKAYAELSKQIPPHIRLQINFNIFPADLDAGWLRDTLVIFENSGNRFNLVVEIVESAELDIERAQREVEALRRYGIKTHLDDFGTGYSNIQNLASLAVDAVKLDRSFAMASEGSLMSKMLGNAVEMVHAAGHRIIVEGVETEDRLAMITATGQVDFVQGYLISRPLDIARFVQFLGEQGMPMAQRPRLVA